MDNNMDTEQNVDTGADKSFDQVFSEIANAFENPAEVDTTQSSTEDSGNDSTEQLQQSEQGTESTTPVENTVVEQNTNQTQTATDMATINYKDLYEQLKQESVAQTGLLYNRLNDLSDKYQSLKQELVTPVANKEPDADAEVLSEVKELFPDIYRAVEIMLRKENEATKNSVQQYVQQSVQPIQQHIQQDTHKNYVNRVVSTHPDVYNLIDSGAIRQWVSTLDPITQLGAQTIMQSGSAEQVIQLIDDYKKTVGTTQSAPLSSPQLQQQPTGQPNLSNREEEIAKRVAAMIGVPSKTPGMNVLENKTNVATQDYDSILSNTMREWEHKNRR